MYNAVEIWVKTSFMHVSMFFAKKIVPGPEVFGFCLKYCFNLLVAATFNFIIDKLTVCTSNHEKEGK